MDHIMLDNDNTIHNETGSIARTTNRSGNVKMKSSRTIFGQAFVNMDALKSQK